MPLPERREMQMKNLRVFALILAGIKICVMVCSFFVYPLPDFAVSVDRFAEHKIIGGRFAVVTPLEADSFFTFNRRNLPRFRYISAHERIKIYERLNYFVENASEDDIKSSPMGLRKLTVITEDREYASQLRFSFNLPEYCNDFTYDGAVDLWIVLTKSTPFFSLDPMKVVINYWMWMYGDECKGVSEREYNKTLTPSEKGELNKLELLIEKLVVWYWTKF